jgi:hypothetical protein
MKRLAILLCVILATPFPALAVESWGFLEGDWAIAIQAGTRPGAGLEAPCPPLDIALADALRDRLEWGIRHGLYYGEGADGDDTRKTAAHGFVDYHFDHDRWRSFLGANLEFFDDLSAGASWSAGPEGGLTCFLTPTAFVMTLIEYNFTFDDADRVHEAFNDGRFVYSLGLGLRY